MNQGKLLDKIPINELFIKSDYNNVINIILISWESPEKTAHLPDGESARIFPYELVYRAFVPVQDSGAFFQDIPLQCDIFEFFLQSGHFLSVGIRIASLIVGELSFAEEIFPVLQAVFADPKLCGGQPHAFMLDAGLDRPDFKFGAVFFFCCFSCLQKLGALFCMVLPRI